MSISETDCNVVVKLKDMHSSGSTSSTIGAEECLSSLPATEIQSPHGISSSFGNIAGNRRRAFVSVAILCFINLINYMDRFTIAGVLVKIKRYYSLDDSQAGLLQTSFIVSYMIMAPIFGYLGDRYSRKWIMVGGISFWSATTLLGSFIPKGYYEWFITLRALVGVGEASYSTVAPTIIGDLFSKTIRTRTLALFYFAIPAGSGLGYIVGSKVANVFGHWYWALRVTPGMGLIAVILTILFLRDPPRGEAEGGNQLRHTSVKQDLLYLMRNRSFVWSTLGFTCVAFATGALAWWAPTYMDYATSLSMDSSKPDKSSVSVNLKFGIITCVAGITGVLIGSGIAQYFRQFNPRTDPLVCAVGMLGSAPFVFLGCVFAASYTDASWALIFFGEVLLCMNWAIVADILLYVVIPTRRAMGAAFQILISHALGDATSPYIIGAVSDAINSSKDSSLIIKYISLQYSLYITAFILVIGGFCFLINSLYIVNDKERCIKVTKGLYSSENLTENEQEERIDKTSNCCPFWPLQNRTQSSRPIPDEGRDVIA